MNKIKYKKMTTSTVIVSESRHMFYFLVIFCYFFAAKSSRIRTRCGRTGFELNVLRTVEKTADFRKNPSPPT